MKIVRSILAVVVGYFVCFVVIMAIHTINFAVHRPDDGKPLMEQMKAIQEDPAKMKAWGESMPPAALLTVLVAWQAGAFLGGGVSALIAGRARFVHAGIIGTLTLVGTIYAISDMHRKSGFSHPDWMVLAGLLLPLPSSLIAGKIVSMLLPSASLPATTTEGALLPSPTKGAFKEGEPPMRPGSATEK